MNAPKVNAFVLAGGRSTRMGRDKALLELAGKPLIAHAWAIASAAGPVRIVSSNEELRRFAPLLHDVYPGQGPLAGIHAALVASDAELNFILSVDSPAVPADFVHWIVARAAESEALAIVPRSRDGRLHPLIGVYRRGFAGYAEVALKAGRNKIEPVLDEAAALVVSGDRWDDGIFANVNTPEELAHLGSSFEPRNRRGAEE